jgi:serine/threonine protein phosphatase PrpC
VICNLCISDYCLFSFPLVDLQRIVGSTTALIAVLRNNELRIANLGDCGICIIRNQNIVFRNEEQQHSFNYPFQLGTGSSDSPRDAQLFVVKVECGDIVIVGSDGIFDNLFDEDIVEEVKRAIRRNRGLSGPIHPQVLAESLAFRAKGASQDLECNSPFESRASREALYHTGGKMDDISVIVAVVEEEV